MARSIWGGAISFGLVNVPVKLFTAVRKKDVRFHQLHEPDGARISQKRVCTLDEAEVPYDEIVKGYEISPGRYVRIEPDELDNLDPEATHTIDIEDFVRLDQIDPLYFDSNYYVLPDERGTRAYSLLARAMQEEGKVGVARLVMRSKQYLAALRPVDGALVLSTMNFADEVVPMETLDMPTQAGGEVPERELTMAKQLIDSLARDFEPERYHDDYRERVLDLIEQKASGAEVVSPTEPERPVRVVDLMAALEASLAAAKASRTDGAAGSEADDGSATVESLVPAGAGEEADADGDRTDGSSTDGAAGAEAPAKPARRSTKKAPKVADGSGGAVATDGAAEEVAAKPSRRGRKAAGDKITTPATEERSSEEKAPARRRKAS